MGAHRTRREWFAQKKRSSAPLFCCISFRELLLSGRFLGDYANLVVEDLHEAAAHAKSAATPRPEPQLAVAEERHQRSMTGEYSHLAVIRGSDDRIALPFEQDSFRRNYRDLRSEERRVGKESRYRWRRNQYKNKTK